MALPAVDVNKIASVAHAMCNIHLSVDFGLSAIVNLAHFTNTIKASHNASCCELVSLIPEQINTITTEINDIIKDLGILGGTFGLLKTPFNLGQVIGWISGFINLVVGLNLSAFIKKEAQLVALIAEATTVVTEVASALSNLGGCAESFLPKIDINIP